MVLKPEAMDELLKDCKPPGGCSKLCVTRVSLTG
jgi:hypothetical protein